MSFTKTGPRWAHAPQAEGDGASAVDNTSALTESRMRQSLERLGGRSAPQFSSHQAGHQAGRPFQAGGGAFANRPRRHGFVRDGEVPVEQARRRTRTDVAQRPEAELQPRPGVDPEARIAAAERAMRESREQARILSTRLGHTELRLTEATARAEAAEAALAEVEARLAALRTEADHWQQAARIATEADDAAEPSGAVQEPVQWWVEQGSVAAPDAVRD